VTGSPEAFGKLVQSEIAKWSQLIKTAKITAD
jgi:tripartite-type tricarboxylate transporter receptor subunit TctC